MAARRFVLLVVLLCSLVVLQVSAAYLLVWFRWERIPLARYSRFLHSRVNGGFLRFRERVMTYTLDTGDLPRGNEYELFEQVNAGAGDEFSTDLLLTNRIGDDGQRIPFEPWARRGSAVIPVDFWGRRYRYRCPGLHLPDAFDLYSVGPNGIDERGEGDDLANWRIRVWYFWTKQVAEHGRGDATVHQPAKSARGVEGPQSMGLPQWTWEMRPIPELLTVLTVACALYVIGLVCSVWSVALAWRERRLRFSEWRRTAKVLYYVSLMTCSVCIVLLLGGSAVYDVR